MWQVHLDVDKQKIIIEDRDGNLIAARSLPHQRFPNPGREELMRMANNLKAWERAFDLVRAANETAPRMPRASGSNSGRRKLFKT